MFLNSSHNRFIEVDSFEKFLHGIQIGTIKFKDEIPLFIKGTLAERVVSFKTSNVKLSWLDFLKDLFLSLFSKDYRSAKISLSKQWTAFNQQYKEESKKIPHQNNTFIPNEKNTQVHIKQPPEEELIAKHEDQINRAPVLMKQTTEKKESIQQKTTQENDKENSSLLNSQVQEVEVSIHKSQASITPKTEQINPEKIIQTSSSENPLNQSLILDPIESFVTELNSDKLSDTSEHKSDGYEAQEETDVSNCSDLLNIKLDEVKPLTENEEIIDSFSSLYAKIKNIKQTSIVLGINNKSKNINNIGVNNDCKLD